MKHCYILNFNDCQVYHVTIPDRLETNSEIETYLHREYCFNEDEISFIITENERSIINLT